MEWGPNSRRSFGSLKSVFVCLIWNVSHRWAAMTVFHPNKEQDSHTEATALLGVTLSSAAVEQVRQLPVASISRMLAAGPSNAAQILQSMLTAGNQTGCTCTHAGMMAEVLPLT